MSLLAQMNQTTKPRKTQMEHIVNTIKSVIKMTHGDVEYRKEYSGRAMYGRKCVGIVGSFHDCQQVIAQVINELVAEDQLSPDDVTTLLTFSYDSMGLDNIIYWPEIVDETVDMSFNQFMDGLSDEERDLLDEWVIHYENSGKVPERSMQQNYQLTEALAEFYDLEEHEELLAAFSQSEYQ